MCIDPSESALFGTRLRTTITECVWGSFPSSPVIVHVINHAYTEGIYEDLNKFLIARLGADLRLDARTLVQEYCSRYFGIHEADAAQLTAAVYQLEPLEANPQTAPQIAACLEDIRLDFDCHSWQAWKAGLAVRPDAEKGPFLA